ncbi:hypothetical protein [Streptosporangium sandarakinum]|uniref:hypothetical protein n=1 Tax=Streptosporangium sandarakinum TaxID=1260955 RepID=UPI003449955D
MIVLMGQPVPDNQNELDKSAPTRTAPECFQAFAQVAASLVGEELELGYGLRRGAWSAEFAFEEYGAERTLCTAPLSMFRA